MNAIIASALLGVLMMFASWIFDNEKTHTRIALVGLLALIVANVLQLNGIYTIPVDYKGLLSFTQFGLYVNTILFILTFYMGG
jgi:NADH-quinone oxidoreductase subunit N